MKWNVFGGNTCVDLKVLAKLIEPLSKLPVSPLLTPIVVPYIIRSITPPKEFRL